MKTKVFWLDVETTGLDYTKHEIITISGIIEVDGEVKEEFDLAVRPDKWDNISNEALEVNDITIKELKTFPHKRVAYKEIKRIMKKYVDPFNKLDKFIIGGYNVGFDVNFLNSLYKSMDDSYLFASLSGVHLDPLRLLGILVYQEKLNLPTYKLVSLTDHFNIPHKSHNSMSDITATRELFLKLLELIK